MPVASSIEIVPLSAEYFDRAIEIANAQLGADYVTVGMLSQAIVRSTLPGASLPISCAALQGGRVVGFSLVQLPGQWESDSLPVTRDAWPCSDKDKADVAYHDVIAVDPLCSRVGIGSRLSQATEAALLATGVRGLVAHVWEASSSAVALSRRRGGIIISIHKGVWMDCRDSPCIACGSPEGGCACDALEVFYHIGAADTSSERHCP